MNKLEILRTDKGKFKTIFTFDDGISMWEIHRYELTDADVLVKLLQKKIYQHKPGEWCISFPLEQRNFEDPTFERAVQLSLVYIHTRDNPVPDEVYYC